jgi:Tol biopolymer transport system component/predicted Ser/Thr protein kinase
MIGQIVSHYHILSKLGAGGMGEVYLAEDQTLGRRVALKILPPAVAREHDRIERFILEARAASAMNHANIAGIHELGGAGDVPFIAMEYVEGRSLDALIADGPLEPFRALDIVRQVTEALAEAHAKGITHRDIKPANIMITPRGVVKVLDFGLAKLLPNALGQWGGSGSDAPTIASTLPGVVLGTVHYMSPEQALARDVDARSDLFSLGVVFYQLLAGRLPFQGDSGTATIDAILHHDPPLPSTLRAELPPVFDRVLARALAKSRDERYASAIELAADLDALARGVEPAAAPVRRAPVRPRTWWLIAVTTSILLTAPVVWYFGRPAVVTGTVTPFTALGGAETWPAFSPDGATIAYTWPGPQGRNLDVYLQAVNGGDPVRLTTSPARDTNPVFSPDGALVAFARDSSKLMIVPRAGGPERELAKIDDFRFTFTPDGRSIAVGGPSGPGGAGVGIRLVSLEGGPGRSITHPPPGSSDLSPHFSPDGTLLAFERVPATNVSDVYIVAATGGEPTRLTFDDRGLDGLTWTSDGKSIVFASGRSGPTRLWRVSKDGGPPAVIVEAPPGSSNPMVDPVGGRLAFNVQEVDTNVWQLPLDETGRPAADPSRLIASTLLDGSPDFSRDGKFLTFASNRTGRDQIWISAPDGSSARDITKVSGTFISFVGSPRWSPDGTRLVFDARVKGNADIYVIPRDGGDWRRLTTDPSSDVIPTWSRDGRWVYFTSRRTGRPEVWRVPSEGGTEARVTFDGGFAAQESLDGTMIYYGKTRELSPLFSRPKAGGAETPLLVDRTGTPHRVVQFACWRPTTNGVVFIEELESNGTAPKRHAIQRLRPDGVLETLAIMPNPASIGAGGIAVSPDGRRVLFTVLDSESSDIYLLQPFR